jgi:hypothetical protein
MATPEGKWNSWRPTSDTEALLYMTVPHFFPFPESVSISSLA